MFFFHYFARIKITFYFINSHLMEKKKHTGGCHCGAVRYETVLDPSAPLACNCSICGRSGTWLTFVPQAEFKLLSGEENVTDYQFGKKRIHHLFCKTCGVRSFARGSDDKGNEMVAVNVRCLDDIELDQLDVKHFNGKAL